MLYNATPNALQCMATSSVSQWAHQMLYNYHTKCFTMPTPNALQCHTKCFTMTTPNASQWPHQMLYNARTKCITMATPNALQWPHQMLYNARTKCFTMPHQMLYNDHIKCSAMTIPNHSHKWPQNRFVRWIYVYYTPGVKSNFLNKIVHPSGEFYSYNAVTTRSTVRLESG